MFVVLSGADKFKLFNAAREGRLGENVNRILIWTASVVVLLACLLAGGLWFGSSKLLFPAWRGVTRSLSNCPAETAKYWGPACGNLRMTHEFSFDEVKIPSLDGQDIPGWSIEAAKNGMPPAHGVILMVHAGGSDRREETRYVRFLLSHQLDVLTIDLECHGEAPCPVPGMTYGERESRDVLSAYLHLAFRYKSVYAMGTSVGASAILIALPGMPRLAGAIVENPVFNFQRLLKETPASEHVPGWFMDLLLKLTMVRGRFDGLLSAEHALRLANATPILFIQSKADEIVPWQHTQALANLYAGPKEFWLLAKGAHAAIWDVNRAEYEQKLVDFLSRPQ